MNKKRNEDQNKKKRGRKKSETGTRRWRRETYWITEKKKFEWGRMKEKE